MQTLFCQNADAGEAGSRSEAMTRHDVVYIATTAGGALLAAGNTAHADREKGGTIKPVIRMQ